MYRIEMRIVKDTDADTVEKIAGVGVSSLSAANLQEAPLHPRIAAGLVALTHAATEVLHGKQPVVQPPDAVDMTPAHVARLLGLVQAQAVPHVTALHWHREKEEFVLLRLSRP